MPKLIINEFNEPVISDSIITYPFKYEFTGLIMEGDNYEYGTGPNGIQNALYITNTDTYLRRTTNILGTHVPRDFSMCVWLNKNQTTVYPFSEYSHDDGGIKIFVTTAAAVLNTFTAVGGGNNFVLTYSGITIANDVWNHFAFLYNASTIRVSLYINGVYNTIAVAEDMNRWDDPPGGNTRIMADSLTRGTKGGIADLRFYDRLLTASEITQIYKYLG